MTATQCGNNLIISLYYLPLLFMFSGPTFCCLKSQVSTSPLNFTIQFSSSERPRSVVYFAFMSSNIDYYSVGRRPSETEVITHVRCRWLSSSHWSSTKLSLVCLGQIIIFYFPANQNIHFVWLSKKDKTRYLHPCQSLLIIFAQTVPSCKERGGLARLV